MKKQICFLLFVSGILLTSCKDPHPISFYHWRTGFAPVLQEKQYLEEIPAPKVYIRAFDLAWDPYKETERQLSYMKIKPDSLKYIEEVVLVVFMTNETIRNMSEAQLPALAARTAFLLNRTRIMFANSTTIKLEELQIDCDWTLKSKDKYFTFLEYMREEARKIGFRKLSATVRLHQVAFEEEAGIPPVDNGVLMFYNMQDAEDPLGRYSLLQGEALAKPLEKLSEYPLHLDVALPLSGWGIQLRDTRAIQIIPNLDREILEAAQCCSLKEESTYRVDSAMYVNNVYVVKGDEIQVEGADLAEVKKAAALLSDEMNEEYRLIFFHLDRALLENLSMEELKEIAEIK